MSLIIIIAYVLSTASGLVLLKLGTASGLPISFIENSIKFNLNLCSMIGMLLYGISFFLYMFLISKFDLGFIIPVTTAIVYILIFFASFVIFKESFTIIKIAAISLIMLGVIILNFYK